MQTPANDITVAIDHLAAKLAVPASKLWAVLVVQARVEAIRTVVVYAVFGAMLTAAWFAWVRLWRWDREENPHDQVASFISATLLGLLSVLYLIGVGIDGSGVVGYLMNPDYYALRQVLEALGRK